MALRFQKRELPTLTNWQHFGQHEYVVGIEPGTNHPIGQAKAREQNELIFLAPGEKKSYNLSIEVLQQQENIDTFLNDLTKAN